MIAVAALVTYSTRVAGPPLGGWLASRHWVEALVSNISLCVLAALGATAVVGGGIARVAGVGIAAATMFVTKHIVAAMIAGAGTAAAIRFILETA